MSNLMSELTRDGLKVPDFERLYRQAAGDPRFVADALAAMEQLDSDVAWRAVWQLRRASVDGRLSECDLRRIAAGADGITYWAGRLLLCQLFGRIACPADARETLFPFFEECLRDKRVITRAWALSALLHFRSDPAYRTEVEAHLRVARREKGKAMQARLRQLKLAPRNDRACAGASRFADRAKA